LAYKEGKREKRIRPQGHEDLLCVRDTEKWKREPGQAAAGQAAPVFWKV
jgi:hypothetical protein